ncbi:hypothetical protein DL347_26350 [Pseudomonas fluorescens]|uniref:Uncharacterized protein n=1 Tax=Pseudomonas fluorescens TaxID=294 RepID=A0A7Z6MSJ2_PSEFL|nr:hypothetical protein DL347_26350 [Pseudomonas fluorescens]
MMRIRSSNVFTRPPQGSGNSLHSPTGKVHLKMSFYNYMLKIQCPPETEKAMGMTNQMINLAD